MFNKIPKWDQDELGTPEFGNIKQVKFLDRINEKQKEVDDFRKQEGKDVKKGYETVLICPHCDEKRLEDDDDELFHLVEKNIYCCNNCDGKVIIN